jgi:hypothetical protein
MLVAEEAQSRLKAKAEEVARALGAPIEQLLADVNVTRLNNGGKIIPAEIQAHHVRWALEWKSNAITYRLRVVVRLADNGQAARAEQTMVQCEASTPYNFEGHTPTTTMRQVVGVDLPHIREAVIAILPI